MSIRFAPKAIGLCWILLAGFSVSAGVKLDQQVAWGDLPLRFEENRGQAPDAVKYLARGGGYTILIESAGSTLNLGGSVEKPVQVRCRLHGANSEPPVTGEERLPGLSNYLIGNDPEAWVTNVPTFARVRYAAVYPGIDLTYYGREGVLEYDFVLRAGADPERIAFSFTGVDEISVEADGDLRLDAGTAVLRWKKPVVYQEVDGVRAAVDGEFRLEGEEVRFQLGDYDASEPLVIDPKLEYATYFGGSRNETARGLAFDSEGNTYIAGYTCSGDLPNTEGGAQQEYGGHGGIAWPNGDAFVAKLNADGTGFVYATYLGGKETDFGMDLVIDGEGHAYVTGSTNSPDFPTTEGAFQKVYQGGGPNQYVPAGDAFVSKLNPDGNALVYSTFLGAERDDRGLAITLDSRNNAYVAGVTMSREFPVSADAFQREYAGEGGNPPFYEFDTDPLNVSGDGFVGALNAGGSELLFATYLGGSKDDALGAIVVQENVIVAARGGSSREMTASGGYIYVAGGTLSDDYPTTPGALQTEYHGYGSPGLDLIRLGDGLVTKLEPNGTGIVYSTYLGGTRDDEILGLHVDGAGQAYVTGATNSEDFPVSETALQKTYMGGTPGGENDIVFGDAFAAQLSAGGDQLIFSTLFGGTRDDVGWDIQLDPWKNVFVVGHTQSTAFPVTEDAIQSEFAGEGGDRAQFFGDGYLIKLSPRGEEILYATYLGGRMDDIAGALRLDDEGNGYVAGVSVSPNFPVTPKAAQLGFGGTVGNKGFPLGDAIVAKFSGLFEPPPKVSIAAIGNAASYEQGKVSPGELVVIYGTSLGPALLAGMELTEDGMVSTTLAETRILFDGTPSPFIYASEFQTSVVVPYSVDGKDTVDVVAEYQGIQSSPFRVQVAPAVPGLISADSTGQGPGAILHHPEYSLNSPANPAEQRSVVILYGTGEGQTSPAGLDGLPATEIFPLPLQEVSVTVGGLDAEVLWAGGAPLFVAGVIQINMRLPEGLPPGEHDVIVTIGGASSQTGLTVSVK